MDNVNYGTALGKLYTCTRLHVQNCLGGDVGTLNIVCEHPRASRS